MGVPPVKNGPHPFLFLDDRPKTILYGRDAILRVRDKWLIFNTIPQLWADVKYHVPTGFGFSPKASCFLCFCLWFHSRFGNNAESIPRNFPLKCRVPTIQNRFWAVFKKKEMGAAHFSLGAHPFPRHITCLNSLGAYSSSVWNTGISRIKLSSSEISVSVAFTPEMCWILSLSSSIKCWLSRA